MRVRNESATMRTATTALRREVDGLSQRMKEEMANLKHECVGEMCSFLYEITSRSQDPNGARQSKE